MTLFETIVIALLFLILMVHLAAFLYLLWHTNIDWEDDGFIDEKGRYRQRPFMHKKYMRPQVYIKQSPEEKVSD